MPADPEASAPRPSVTALACPNCGGSVALRAAGYTVTVGCEYCGTVFDASNPQVKRIKKHHRFISELSIPLGTRATIEDVEWEAIGHLRRSIAGAYPWEEYLLFNPYRGYRWLVSDGRSWNFGEMLTETPEYGGFDTFSARGMTFRRFFKESKARVDSVVGEFYWRVKVRDTADGADWVRPGWMLSREKDGKEVSWTLSRMLDPDEIRAFGVEPPDRPWPPPPHATSPWAGWVKRATPVALIAVALLLIAIIALAPSGGKLAGFAIPQQKEEVELSATIKSIVLDRPFQRVDITARAPLLENGWIDFDFSLVNQATQQSYDTYGAAERYSGYDSDGAWTEGGRRVDVSLEGIPAGTYDLVIDYKTNRWSPTGFTDYNPYDNTLSQWNGSASPIEITVSRSSIFFSSVLIALLLVLLPFLFAWTRYIHFEKERQWESDFPPTGVAAVFKSSE